MQEAIRKLFDWEAEARGIVADGSACARAIREEAERIRTDRLVQAKDQAREKAEQISARILEHAEQACQLKLTRAEEKATGIEIKSAPKMGMAVQTALEWLLASEKNDVSGR